MASQNPPFRTYKGHPQIFSVEERLHQITIFLADEDRHRCMDFDRKFAEIKEYLQHVEKENLAENKTLFQQVKVMTTAQEEWHDVFMDAPPVETTACTAGIYPYSTRLIDARNSERIKEERADMGLTTQMREDHPPFTVNRSEDHFEFLRALEEHASSNPDILDEEENLTNMEAEAYSWALTQPSLIPYWLHWEKGLPNEGRRLGDDPPWYRANQTMFLNGRPPPDQLPKYLQDREDAINKLLGADSSDLYDKLALAKLMCLYLPTHLAEKCDRLTKLAARWRCGLLSAQESSQAVPSLLKFFGEFDSWTTGFKSIGVQIMVKKPDVEEVNLPGVFYVLLEHPPEQAKLQVKIDEDKVNELLHRRSPTRDETEELMSLLEPYFQEDIRTFWNESRALILEALDISKLEYESTVDKDLLERRARRKISGDKKNVFDKSLKDFKQIYGDWVVWLKQLNTSPPEGNAIQLKYLIKGELPPEEHHILARPWDPTLPPSPADLGQPPSEVRKIQSEINDILHHVATHPSVVDESTLNQLRGKLENVLPPDIRQLAAFAKQSLAGSNEVTAYTSAYERWQRPFLYGGVRIRVPLPGASPEISQSTVLYFSGDLQLPDGCADLVEWAARVKAAVRKPSLKRELKSYRSLKIDEVNLEETDFGDIYHLLKPLQYPVLRQMDQKWRRFPPGMPDSPSDPHRGFKKQRKLEWLQNFYAWIDSFVPDSIEVKQGGPELVSQYPLNDPRIVFYRGPVQPSEMEGSVQLQPLPVNIQEDSTQISALLKTRASRPLDDDEEKQLFVLICTYWPPGKRYLHDKALRDKLPAPRQKAIEQELNQRFKVFSDASAGAGGVTIIRLPKQKDHDPDTYVALDTTQSVPQLWKVDGGSLVDEPCEAGQHPAQAPNPSAPLAGEVYLRSLNANYAQPAKFYRSLELFESAINTQLNKIKGATVSPDVYHPLSQFLRPFFSGNLKIYADSGDTYTPKFESLLLLFIQSLAAQCRVSPIKIQVEDLDRIRCTQFPYQEGILYFRPPDPQTTQQPTPIQVPSHRVPGQVPTGYEKIQARINELLPKFRDESENPEIPACQMTWEEDEELRCLLRAVMTPDVALIDQELRDLRRDFRNGVLDEGEHATYLARQSEWRENYTKWVLALPLQVSLRKLEYDSPRDPGYGILYVYAGDSWNLPDPEAARKLEHLPVPWQVIQDDLNKTLRQTPNSPLSSTQKKLLKDYFRPTSNAIENKLRDDLKDRPRKEGDYPVSPPGPVNPDDEEGVAYIRGVQLVQFQNFLEDLKSSMTDGKTSLVLDNPHWGNLVVREIPLADGAPPVPRLKQDLVDNLCGRLDRATFDTVTDEFLRIAQALRRGLPNVREDWSELRRLLMGDPIPRAKISVSQLEANKANELMGRFQDVRGNHIVFPHLPYPTPGEKKREEAIDDLLRHLWTAFVKLLPQTMEGKVESELITKSPLKQLIKAQAVAPPPLYQVHIPEFDQNEISRVSTELNNMLAADIANNKIRAENKQLDFLLQPLTQGDLASLSREISRLVRKSLSEGNLNAAESVALDHYRQQYCRDFQDWKAKLAKTSIILDNLYTGADVVTQVVYRFQLWQALHPPTPRQPRTMLENKAREDLARKGQHYQHIKPWLKNPFPRQEPLMVFRMALPHMSSMMTTLQELKEKQDEGDLRSGGRLALSDGASRLAREWMDFYTSLPEKTIRLIGDKSTQLRAETAAPDDSGPLTARLLGDNSAQLQDNGAASEKLSSATVLVSTDFSGKAERRGVQRASIELGLNLLATGSGQLRPHDKFRKVRLPPKYQPPLDEVPLCESLEPYERPIEMGTYKYTNIMRKYRQWKDNDYQEACDQATALCPTEIAPQENYRGPSTLMSDEAFEIELQERQHALFELQRALKVAEESAPRPLIRRLLLRLNQGVADPEADVLYDDVPLTQKDMDILLDIAQPSWDNVVHAYPHPIPKIENTRFHEFERDLERYMADIPFWEPALVPEADGNNPNHPRQFEQHPYNKQEASQRFIQLSGSDSLIQRINNDRLQQAAAAGTTAPPWSVNEASSYLNVMHNADRIHFNSSPGNRSVARIPRTGHPEDKYFVSREAVRRVSYVKKNPHGHGYVVQYDASGRLGTPIIQPNKYENLQKIAFRVGRDINQLTHSLANSTNMQEMYDLQQEAATRASDALAGIKSQRLKRGERDISFQKLARDLHKVAPDLAAEACIVITDDHASLNEQQAAHLLQMQIIQESNNKWESRFPEHTNLWDWAAPRTTATVRAPRSNRLIPARPKQFFNMRKWPPAYQCHETQTKIAQQDPKLQAKPEPSKQEEIRRQRAEDLRNSPKERHTGRGQQPFYPFGESRFSQAWLSFRMEDDLKNVEEFNPKRQGLLGKVTRSKGFKDWVEPLVPGEEIPRVDRLKLPDVPAGWDPDSVTRYEKEHAIAEDLIAAPGFPNAPEVYFTPEEIAARNRRITTHATAEAMRYASGLVENDGILGGMHVDDMTRAELKALQEKHNVDPFTGQVKHTDKETANKSAWDSFKETTQASTMTSGGTQTPAAERSTNRSRAQEGNTTSSPVSKRTRASSQSPVKQSPRKRPRMEAQEPTVEETSEVEEQLAREQQQGEERRVGYVIIEEEDSDLDDA